MDLLKILEMHVKFTFKTICTLADQLHASIAFIANFDVSCRVGNSMQQHSSYPVR